MFTRLYRTNDNVVSAQLRCDVQKQGCFQCKASSAACSNKKYRSKKEIQQNHDAHRRTRSRRRTFSQNEISPNQQNLPGPGKHPEVCSRSMEETFDTVLNNQTPRYEDTPVGTISSPDINQGLRAEDEELLSIDSFLTRCPTRVHWVTRPQILI